MLAVGFLTFLAAVPVFGQPSAIRMQVSFPFTVEGRALPAGTYDIVKDEVAGVFKVSNEAKNEAAASILTRLSAGAHMAPSEAQVVFDKLGETYLLSEIWIPGQDGYALAITKAKHEHVVVKGKK